VHEGPDDGLIQSATCSHGKNIRCVWLRICRLPLLSVRRNSSLKVHLYD